MQVIVGWLVIKMESRSFPIYSLTKEELQYEVQIRSEEPEPTVEKLRKQLKRLILDIPPEEILELDIEARQELKLIADKLKELKKCIGDYEATQDTGRLVRARALGTHLHFRIARVITVDEKTEEYKQEYTRILKELSSKFSDKGSVDKTPVGGAFEESTSAKVEGHQLSQVHCSKVNVSKWGLKFDGTTDVRSFLERVDELCSANNVPVSKIFAAASELFSEQALLWFRGIKNQVTSWHELRELLMEEFDPVDYEYRLMGEIRARTQGADEPVHIYFAIMSCMFNRLSCPPTEREKLEILLHNIRPSFSEQLALIEINSTQELKAKCRILEAARQRSEFFAEPARAAARTLNPSFNYKSTKAKPNLSAVSTVPQERQKFVCFKCKEPGHSYKECKNKRSGKRIQCYNCGQVGYTVKGCPNCNKETNEKKPQNPKN